MGERRKNWERRDIEETKKRVEHKIFGFNSFGLTGCILLGDVEESKPWEVLLSLDKGELKQKL